MKKKKDNIPTGIESSRRIFSGMPGGEPNTGTSWKDTLLVIFILIILSLLYISFN